MALDDQALHFNTDHLVSSPFTTTHREIEVPLFSPPTARYKPEE